MFRSTSFHYNIDEMRRNLTLVYINEPMVKLSSLSVLSLKVVENLLMISEDLLYLLGLLQMEKLGHGNIT